MTNSYFNWAEDKSRKPPKLNEHGGETVDIPGIIMTETPPEEADTHTFREPMSLSQTLLGIDLFANDRHGYVCSCAGCRIDRGEETL